MTTLLLYAFLAAYCYYLGARAEVTRFLWSRYAEGGFLDRLTWCPACSGFWYGTAIAIFVGMPLDLGFLGLAARTWYTPFVVGIVTGVTTVPIAWGMIRAMQSEAFERPEPAPMSGRGGER